MYCDSLGLDNAYHSSEKGEDWDIDIAEDAISQTVQWEEPLMKQLFEENENRLKRLAELSASRNIRLIFIIPPVHSLYLSNTDESQWRLVHNALIKLESQWNHISYKDYSHSEDFTDIDFYDGNHLNADIGGVKFSRMVKNDFESIFLSCP